MHQIDIQYVKSRCSAGDHLKYRGEDFISQPVDVFQCVIVFQQKEKDAAYDNNGKRDVKNDFGLWQQRFPSVFIPFSNIAETEKITDGDEPDAAKEDQGHDNHLREIAPRYTKIQQTVIDKYETAVVKGRNGVENGEEQVLFVR